MVAISAVQVRNEWTSMVDMVMHEKPQFIKQSHGYMFLTDFNVLEYLLSAYTFNAKTLLEDDGSVTIILDEIDLVENGQDEQEAQAKLARAILEYSEDYYNDFAYWSKGSNVSHIPYVFKSLMLNDVAKIGELIKCRRGEI